MKLLTSCAAQSFWKIYASELYDALLMKRMGTIGLLLQWFLLDLVSWALSIRINEHIFPKLGTSLVLKNIWCLRCLGDQLSHLSKEKSLGMRQKLEKIEIKFGHQTKQIYHLRLYQKWFRNTWLSQDVPFHECNIK